MTREEFVQESAMRNMHAFINRLNISTDSFVKNRNTYAEASIGLANAMADYLFSTEDYSDSMEYFKWL